MRIRAIATATLVAIVAACSDDNTTPPTSPFAVQSALATTTTRLVISPEVDTVEIGKTITLTASLRDASAGDSATSTQSSTDSTPLRWGLDNTSLASVRAGKVLGLKEGTVRIVALSGNSYGFSTVVVVRAAVAEVTEPTSPPVVSVGSVGSLYSGYQAT
ncbi:MAG TPA: Ig-like domain-containing protein, partial [Gemmatimonadaceae bacterium]